jgi:hypothetical protein
LAGEKINWTDRLVPRGDFVLRQNKEKCATFLHLSLRLSCLVGCHFVWLLDPALSLRLRPVKPLVTPLSFGWFVALPRDLLAFRTNGCRVASRHAVASCASTPLICESIRRRLPPLLPPHPSRTTSPSPERERERGLPEHHCFCCCRGARPSPERGLTRHCHRRGHPRLRPSPAPPPPPLPSPHALVARAWPQGGSESKWMMSSVPGTPLELCQRVSCVSRL